MKPTEEQLKDPKWWGKNAPTGAALYDKELRSWLKKDFFFAWLVWREDQQLWGKAGILVDWDSRESHMAARPVPPPEPKQSTDIEIPASTPTPPTAEWDGEGLPPVGCTCEFKTPAAESGWANCLVMGYYEDLVWITAHFKDDDDLYSGKHLTMGVTLMEFRPLRTKEQREREELAEALSKAAYRMGFALDLEESDAFADAVLTWLKERPQ